MNRSRRQRLGDFRRAAQLMLGRYSLPVTRIDFVADFDCVVFRVRLHGYHFESATLRLYPSYYGGAGYIGHEVDWLLALARDTDLLIPEPLAARDGSLVQTFDEPVHDMTCCVLMSWVPGRFLEKGLTPRRLHQVGQLAGQLHKHSRDFVRAGTFPRTRHAYLPEFAPWIEQSIQRPEWFTRAERMMLATAAEKLQVAVERLPASGDEYGLVHGDLHLENFLFHRGRAGAIDFNDCGWGHYVLDMASTLVYIKHPMIEDAGRTDSWVAMRDAFLEGYASARNLPRDWQTSLDILIAVRLFVLLGWMTCHWPELDHLPWGPGGLKTAVNALRKWS